MPQTIDLDKRFDDWFNEQEAFGLRSERFFDSLDQFKSKEGLQANLIIWLKAAYLHGVRVAAQDSVETLYDYATACAGLEPKLSTPEEDYDHSAEALNTYWCGVLESVQD
jgi:hypothetical protein